jgi:hypothetical protein
MCGGGGGADKNVGKAAKMQAELAKEQLQWFKDEYANSAGARAAAEKRANEIGDFQLGQMREQDARADELYDWEKQHTRPIQERLATEALNYDTKERRDAAADAAAADVQAASSNQQQILGRNLARQGVNPASGAAYSRMQDNALQTAAMSAGAQNSARRQVEAIGYGRMADAVGGGMQMAQRGSQAASMAAGAGQGAIGASQASLGARTHGLGGMQTAYQTAGQMMGTAGNLYAQNAQAANAASQSQTATYAGLASAAMMAFAMSDERKKSGTGKPADTAAALAAVEATPVHDGWTYDPAKGGPDDGRRPHTGPMAQDVARTMGEQAAPGGTAIDLVSMNGVTLAAVQEVAKRVKKLEQKATA